MSMSKHEQVSQVIDTFFEAAMQDHQASFAWELFWKFDIIQKFHDFNTQVMFSAIVIDKRKDFDMNETIDVKDPLVMETIKERKKVLMKQHGIKRVKFDAYRERIVFFFKEKRNIDFDSLDEAGVKKAFFDEDVISHPETIYDALGITHMQFKYLYQKGGVQIKTS